MPIALDRNIRDTLRDVVKAARTTAETGARNALNQLGVGEARRPSWLDPDQAKLRNRLRAHARSLGDELNADDTMRLSRLVREIAYAYWHRALFTRFLLENGLLVDVEAGNAPVSATDLSEIAEAEGKDIAEIAAEFAAPMLPEIFPKDDPVLALTIPPEARQEIAQLVAGLPARTFLADDSLGWTYQFWQADRKKQINESEVKIGADELPAVTQLFTEDYMVLFLLENTLGAWWAGKQIEAHPELASGASDEDELRRRLSLPGYQWTYLRFIRDEDGHWSPAAGVFPGWPQTAREITLLDPCMGSGHFLVFALAIIVALRRAEENLGEEAAVMAVLAENLHGLEIDPRCTQIAAFAMALSAWKRIGRVRPLPHLHLACSGLAVGMGKTEFVGLAERIAEAEGFAGGAADLLGRERNPMEEAALARRRRGLEALYDLFAQAPVLGSLIEPSRALGDFGDLFVEGFDGLSSVLEKVLSKTADDFSTQEAAVTAQGLSKAAELLRQRFTLIATNVPYLTRNKMSYDLRDHVDKQFADGKGELASAFIQRLFKARTEHATTAIVFPQNILFLTTYKKFRQQLLKDVDISAIVALGEEAWQSFGKRGPLATLMIYNKRHGNADVLHYTLDASNKSEIADKIVDLKTAEFVSKLQSEQFANPDHRITFGEHRAGARLGRYASALQGVSPADTPKYAVNFWELSEIHTPWTLWQGASNRHRFFGGSELMLRYGNDLIADVEDGRAYVRSEAYIGKKSISISLMRRFCASINYGAFIDTNVAAVLPNDEAMLAPIWCFLTSDSFLDEVRRIDKKVNLTNATVTKVPFDLARWQRVAADKYPNGLPKPYSNDPTQRLFDGHPRGSVDPNAIDFRGLPTRPGLAEHPLQVAVARLLGYRWPRQTGTAFMDCPALTEPDEIELSGRIDADGIVCLPSLHGKAGASERLRGLLQAGWGEAWAEGVVGECLRSEGARAEDLDTWFAEEFFDGHCKLFRQAPFIWQVWDGLAGGFSALVNYHKLCAPDGGGRRLLEKLRDTYLGEWIARQRSAAADGDALAEERLAAAEHLRGELTKIIEGDPPYDIFVRWKPLSRQPIGWEPDIDDGVRLNIRPFLNARPRNARSQKACILRITPGVKKHAAADRGGEPFRDKANYPWFWAEDHDVETTNFTGGAEFKGRRYNDFHYGRAFKQAARRAAPGSEAAE